tara:strand:- start:75 stop:890 length:816 start_codon:yes stop_codon:yes gene_type:complete
MNNDDLKTLAWGIFIIYILVVYSIEYPTFGFILVFSIVVISIFFLITVKKDEKEFEVIQKMEEKKEKRKQKLIDKLADEFQKIIEKNFKVVANAYRESVTSNAFGKKNYDKFSTQLNEYIRDNSRTLVKLNEEFDTEVDFNVDSLITFIENKLEKIDTEFDYSDDMDPFDYERLCANEFSKNGWDAKATQGSSDQGVDVVAEKANRTLVAQCKRFAKPVGNKAVQEVVAGMKFYDANEGIVIAPNGFTVSAKKLAKANKVKLIHHSEINSL